MKADGKKKPKIKAGNGIITDNAQQQLAARKRKELHRRVDNIITRPAL